MELPQLLESQARSRIVFNPPEHRFQITPEGPLGGDKFVQIDNHKSCCRFTLRYCVTKSALSRSFSSSEKSTPRRCKTFCSSRRLCHCKWPRNSSYRSSCVRTSVWLKSGS